MAAVSKWKVQQLLIITSFLKSFSCIEGQRVEFLVKIIAWRFKGFEKMTRLSFILIAVSHWNKI